MSLAEERGLTHMQVFALYTLHRHGSLMMGRVATELHCDASNVTGIVDRLAAQGLIVRQEYEHDRRVKQLQLTDKAKQIIDEIAAALPERLGCEVLTAAERDAFHALVNKIGS
jgi:DNA-binding MarR family transcriptional regulator